MSRNDDNKEGAKDSSTEEELMSRSESSASSFLSRSRSPVRPDVGISSGVSQLEEESQTTETHTTVNKAPIQTDIRELVAPLDGPDRADVVERAHEETPLQDRQMLEDLGASNNIEEEVERDPLLSTTKHQQEEILFTADELPSSRRSSESSTSTQLAGELKNKEVLSQDYAEEREQLRRGRRVVTRPENTSVEVVSISTQTEWSWLKDVELYQDILNVRKPEWADRREKKLSREGPESSTANNHGLVKRHRRSVGRRRSVNSDREQTIDEDGSLLESDEGIEAKKTDGIEEGSTGSQPRRKSKRSSVPKSHRSVDSPLPHTPKGGDILFRPPTVEPESSSSSEENNDDDLQVEYMLPSIGPPTILQYMKESQNPPLSNVQVRDREEAAKDEMLRKSMFSAPCMFCQEEVLPFPSVEELELFPPDQLFCCPQYERLVKFELAQRSDRFHLVDELIDVKPHPPYGTKAARRAAKERAAERAREREIERQRVAGGNATNFYALTRQMKTITYSLASTKCMEEGWTVRPESASVADSEVKQDPFVIEVNPLQLRKQTFLERFYDNKRRFLVVLPDGTGCCYYPSGSIAVLITSTEKGKFTYIAYDDEEDNIDTNNSRMLAIFQPSGHGTCYYRNGRVRLVLNPLSGVLLDSRGNRRKRWLWHNLKEHVHAPPFQPITFMITRHLSIRCLSQTKTVLTFNHGKHTARFNVGVKIKAVPKARPQTSRDSYETHLAEVKQFVSILVDRAQTAMRLPNYPRLDKIPLPLHLQRAKDAGRKSRLQTASPSTQQETTITVN